jgi:hypothetical protein
MRDIHCTPKEERDFDRRVHIGNGSRVGEVDVRIVMKGDD